MQSLSSESHRMPRKLPKHQPASKGVLMFGVSRHISSSATLLATVALFAGCQSSDDDVTITNEQAVIVGTEDWSTWNMNEPRKTDFPGIKVGARSAFRVRFYDNFNFEVESCSGVMIDDEHFVTAHHCLHNDEPPFVPDGLSGTLSFGPSANGSVLDYFKLRRLQQLDLRTTIVGGGHYGGLSGGCGMVYNGYDAAAHDLVVGKCPAKELKDSDLNNVRVPLGSIWGHASMTYDTLEAGDKVVGTWQNANPWDPEEKQIHWSPGEIFPGSVATSTYAGRRKMSADALPGSSGGALWGRQGQAVIGLYTHSVDFDYNMYTPLLDEVVTNYREFEPHHTDLDHSTQQAYEVAITESDTYFALKCDDDKTAEELPEGVSPNPHMAAVGVYGSVPLAEFVTNPEDPEGSDAIVGMRSLDGQNLSTFGLICAPYYDHTGPDGEATQGQPILQTARYTVIGKGGYYPRDNHDTSDPSGKAKFALNDDYVRYMQMNYEQQELHCKPGYYLQGVKYRKNEAGVGQITQILCKNPKGSTDVRSTDEVVHGEIGTGSGVQITEFAASSQHVINALMLTFDQDNITDIGFGSIEMP